MKLDLATLKRMRRALKRNERVGNLKAIPAQLRSPATMTIINSSSDFARQVHDPEMRIESKRFNLSVTSNSNYLPAALAQAAAGGQVHGGDNACSECKNGNGPFSKCVTLTLHSMTDGLPAC